MFFNITGKGYMVLGVGNSSVTTQDAVKHLILSNGLKIATICCETPAKLTIPEVSDMFHQRRSVHHATRTFVHLSVFCK